MPEAPPNDTQISAAAVHRVCVELNEQRLALSLMLAEANAQIEALTQRIAEQAITIESLRKPTAGQRPPS